MAVRPYGRAVLMGGVGMLGGDDLSLPYPWIMRNCVSIHGQWMFEPSAVLGMIALVRAGLLDLGQFDVTEFALDDANEAVAHAASACRAVPDHRAPALSTMADPRRHARERSHLRAHEQMRVASVPVKSRTAFFSFIGND